ncbi:IS481 family transposase [Alloalcanivorax xenomutans]|jgi:transposase InsO family protein|uniref:IS481 family transposase n=1 Tax=Alloalcanivorax xenomutans TaxID=1094342 RepID=A0A9Q3W6I4_9GAMM|nr:IS481 family transposase [Alloalcanivorax xenomutans]ARB45435.1 transposase [Alloalcanivorax xenomutans]ARB46848.1 transposase [Alloalcanivorax xenomutans]MCE7511415.1 IS481 family transposase [Alloalcanivorax xenomutans]MCE7522325.1 IS481 family transposase [Alloalcanivorax xenomutans]
MTTDEKVARRKLSLLELAQDLGNVSRACKVMGYSRQQFYEIRRNFQTYGSEGLIDRLPGARGPHPNRVSEEIEEAVLAYCLKEPTHGCLRVAQSLALEGVTVSSMGVRGVWARHNLQTKHERLMRLEQATREKRVELTERQVRLLERFSPEFRERHIITNHTGELVAVDTFYVGQLKGVGKVYLQTVIDCFSRYAWGRLYTSKLPITAVHVLNNDVLPFFEKHNARISTILSDNGREFCGRPDTHPYELFLQLEEIEHRTTRVRRPQSNGFVERMHRTLLDEHFRIKGREKWYESVDEMQTDLDDYLVRYNTKRPHQGRDMNGRTPYAVFMKGLPKEKKTVAKSALKTA